jgi:7-carboxy-7-deazaguanine synthase
MGVHLPVMEQFYTIQGEGRYTGQASYFIRLGGCDVGCVWCDVKESWDAGIHPVVAVPELVRTAASFPGGIVVVTGGEPAMYNLEPLTAAIHQAGKRAHIETSGVHPLTGTWDWVCFSPKKFKAPHPSVYTLAHELKVVIYHKSDIEFAEKHAAMVGPGCELFLQPEWSRREELMPLIVAYVKENPRWRISLQTHKYLNIP